MPILRAILLAAAIASLLLGALISVVWIRSDWIGDERRWVTIGELREAGSAGGVVYLDASGGWSKDPRDDELPNWTHQRGRMTNVSGSTWVGLKLMGFAWVRDTLAGAPHSSPSYHWFVSIPYWFLVGVTLVLPAIWTLRNLESVQALFRTPDGLCGQCGYDLRGTPERCPECGKRVEPRATVP